MTQKKANTKTLRWDAVKFCPVCGRRQENKVDYVHEHIASLKCSYCQLFIQCWLTEDKR